MTTYSTYTDVGKRQNNEDYIGVREENGVYAFIIADGLGGHGRGEEASKLVVEEGLRLVSDVKNIERYVEKAFEISQEKLLKYQKVKHAVNEMKTTEVILAMDEKKVIWGHIGDSRLYFFKRNRLVKRTLDHSYVQNLCMTGEIKEKEIRNHPDRNVLLRVMGVEWNEPKYELSKLRNNSKGASYLLCTDGFWELINEKEMIKCLKLAKNPDEWLALMKNIINENGKDLDMDNYSAIAVWVR